MNAIRKPLAVIVAGLVLGLGAWQYGDKGGAVLGDIQPGDKGGAVLGDIQPGDKGGAVLG
jgi:hypothetical protein